MGAICKINIRNFRSINSPVKLSVNDSICALIGQNGVGKTNSLKALTHLTHSNCISSSDLPRDHHTDRNLGNIKILSVKIENLHKEEYPFFSPPFTFDDLDIESAESVEAKFSVSNHIEPHTVNIAKYAGGRRVIEFPDAEFPSLDMYEFINQRTKDLINLVSYTIETIDEHEYLHDAEYSNIESISEAWHKLDLNMEKLQNLINETSEDHILQEAKKFHYTLDQLLEAATELDQIDNDTSHILPPIINAMEINELQNPIKIKNIANSKEYSGLIKLGGSNIPSFKSENKSKKIEIINDGCEKLEDYLNGFWDHTQDLSSDKNRIFDKKDTNKFDLSVKTSDEGISILISKDQGPEVTISEASRGIQWTTAFLLRVINEVGESRRNAGIFILDDLGGRLHPGAQEFLLSTLKSISAGNQIIYSTHSPFLIDIDNISNIRLVKWNSDNGTTITDGPPKRDEGDIDLWSPVRTALGANVANLPFASKSTILVEGYTEMILLQQLNSFFKRKQNRFNFDNNVRFLDFDGSKAAPLSKFLEGEELKHVILLDSDKGGEDTKKSLKKANVDIGRVCFIGDLISCDENLPTNNPSLEDLFGIDLYCRAIKKVQIEDITSHDLSNDVKQNIDQGDTLYQTGKIEMKKLEGRTDMIEEAVVNKGDYCDTAISIMLEENEKYSDIIDRFEEMMKILGEKLEDRK